MKTAITITMLLALVACTETSTTTSNNAKDEAITAAAGEATKAAITAAAAAVNNSKAQVTVIGQGEKAAEAKAADEKADKQTLVVGEAAGGTKIVPPVTEGKKIKE